MKQVILKLDLADAYQILDALDARVEVWRRTADYLRTGEVDEEGSAIEECSSEGEAAEILSHYEDLAAKVRRQVEGE